MPNDDIVLSALSPGRSALNHGIPMARVWIADQLLTRFFTSSLETTLGSQSLYITTLHLWSELVAATALTEMNRRLSGAQLSDIRDPRYRQMDQP